MFLYTVSEVLMRAKVPFAIVGGYAVALHGAVRGTVDIDIVLALSRKQFSAAEAALRSLGLEPRLPVTAFEVFDFREEYIKNRNLIAWSFFDPKNATNVVDIIITHDLRKLRIKKISSGGHALPVLALEDLVALKTASGRPQDLEDIRALKELNS